MGFYIGIASASQGNKETCMSNAITQLAAAISPQRNAGGFPESPSLDVNFLLPGKFEKAAFKGMQMGGYIESGDTLFFECAVPEAMLNSVQAEAYVKAVIEDVISNAADYFSSIAVHFDPLAWRRSIDQPQDKT